MKKFLLFTLTLFFGIWGYGQQKNFIDLPYLETSATVDTLLVPDRIHLNIFLNEKDTKDRTSVEVLENRMLSVLKSLGIDMDEQLKLADLASGYKDYFLRKTGVIKSKAFTLLVYDALTAGKVIQGLELKDLANVQFSHAEISTLEAVKLSLMARAVSKAKLQATTLLQPLGQELGKVIYISESTPFYATARAKNSFNEMAVMDQAAPIDVDFKEIKVSSTVNVKFAIQ